MTVTVDINVLLDVLQQRQPHHAASAQVINLVISGVLTGVFRAHGLTTLYYLIRKHASKPEAEAAVNQVLRCFQIGTLDSKGWQAAQRMMMTDFEDAVVAAVAETTKSAFIITRNVNDFPGSPVPAIAPVDFLSRINP